MRGYRSGLHQVVAGALGFGVATLLATILYLLVTAAGVTLAPHRRR